MVRFVLSLIFRGQARDAKVDDWSGTGSAATYFFGPGPNP
jgi:hypothetical protein